MAKQKLFIAGICGTFMAGIAQIAKSMGHEVVGCDENVYPPMSEVLKQANIEVRQGYLAEHIAADVDCVLIGNALSRGNPIVEHVLNNKVPYLSGPGWLHQNILRQKKVIAVAGTHGKTTTSSIIAWICHCAGLKPGYLIGGKPGNFTESAVVGEGDYFVIEADEYDTAFFDKRSKFVHYCPDIAVLNNLEFDHGDIFNNIDDIKRQFHHLLRIVPGKGTVVANQGDENLSDVVQMGCWSNLSTFGLDNTQTGWSAELTQADGSSFKILLNGEVKAELSWKCFGAFNVNNALAAIAACSQINIPLPRICAALEQFSPSARRMQQRFSSAHWQLYEDFAHHPTAIAQTLRALKDRHPDNHLVALMEPRSNTMQMGHAMETLAGAFNDADEVIIYSRQELGWRPQDLPLRQPLHHIAAVGDVIATLELLTSQPTTIVAMSNGSFDGIPGEIQTWLESRSSAV